MRALLGYIRRFGFRRGVEFRRVAAKCGRDQHLLSTWSTHYRAKASREFAHDNPVDGHAYMAFAELLSATHSTLVLKRKPRQPILDRQHRRIERVIKRKLAQKQTAL
jgi:hypothetical protein